MWRCKFGWCYCYENGCASTLAASNILYQLAQPRIAWRACAVERMLIRGIGTLWKKKRNNCIHWILLVFYYEYTNRYLQSHYSLPMPLAISPPHCVYLEWYLGPPLPLMVWKAVSSTNITDTSCLIICVRLSLNHKLDCCELLPLLQLYCNHCNLQLAPTP